MSCVLPSKIAELREDVKKKGGAKFLRDMTTQERIDYLANIVDTQQKAGKITNTENAEILNRQIETKMLEPAQTAAIREWLQNLPKDKHINTFARDTDIVDMMLKNKQVLTPKEGKPFLEALVKQKFGFAASLEDTQKLMLLAETASAARKELNAVVPNYETMTNEQANKATESGKGLEARTDLGIALLRFKEQLDIMQVRAATGLTQKEQEGLIAGIKKNFSELITKGKTWEATKRTAYGLAGTLKAAKASVDVSFLLRQLGGTWFTHPKLAWRSAKQGFTAFGQALKTGDGKASVMIELMTRPNALNGNYDKFKLAIGITEEAFAANVFHKVKNKNVGKVFRLITASDDAFNVALQVARAELFDVMWEQTGGDVDLLIKQDVVDAINTITGRGKLPVDQSKAEKYVNVLMFSPRWLSSRVQQITNLRFIGSYFDKTPNGLRARAAVHNVLFMLAASAVGIAIRRALGDDEEELEEQFVKTFDPRSADFMNITIGDLHIDTSVGVANFVRFVARAMTGEIRTGEGAIQQKSTGDILMRFLASKESPIMQNVRYGMMYAFAEDPVDFNYDPITAKTFAQAFVPITVQDLANIKTDSPETWAGAVLNVVGISSQTWGNADKNIGKSAALLREQERLAYKTNRAVKSLKAAKNSAINTKLTGAKRDRANREFEQNLSRALDRLIGSAAYKRMTDAQKNEAMGKIRTEEQRKIKKKYGIK